MYRGKTAKGEYKIIKWYFKISYSYAWKNV